MRRINFYGGPGVGKSVLAASLFAELKRNDVSVELIQEYAKELAYDGIKIKPYDQLKIFAEQISREYRVLNSNPKTLIVTDSPFFMSIPYAQFYGFTSWKSLVEISKSFEQQFPSINFLIKRDINLFYTQDGRYETFDQAQTMDMAIKNFLNAHQVPFLEIGCNDIDYVKNMVEKFLT